MLIFNIEENLTQIKFCRLSLQRLRARVHMPTLPWNSISEEKQRQRIIYLPAAISENLSFLHVFFFFHLCLLHYPENSEVMNSRQHRNTFFTFPKKRLQLQPEIGWYWKGVFLPRFRGSSGNRNLMYKNLIGIKARTISYLLLHLVLHTSLLDFQTRCVTSVKTW